MRAERRSFLTQLEALTSACDQSLLTQLPVLPANELHNERARQLRSGICVRLFAALEEFVRLRVAQVLQSIDPNRLAFGSLPVALQDAAMEGAIRSLALQAGYLDSTARSAHLIAEYQKLASLGSATYALSKYSLAHSKINLQTDELESLLLALNVEKPLETVYRAAQRLNAPLAVSLKNDFDQLQATRHAAAHNQSFDIANNDLRSKVDSARALGTALDIVMSCAAMHLNHKANASSKFRAADLVIYGIRSRRGGGYLCKRDGSSQTLCSNLDLNFVRSNALARIATTSGTVVVLDGTGRPAEWYCRSLGD